MPGFRSLDEGEEVEFIVRLGKSGMEAIDVCGLGGVPLRGHRIHPLGKRKEKEIRWVLWRKLRLCIKFNYF